MKKPWSISTTVRNPTRIISFLGTLKEIEGKKFDHENQLHFQILLIKNKLYTPTDLTNDEKKQFDDDEGINFELAKQIFDNHNYTDPAMRGRNSFAVLKKMGLCVGSKDIPIKITDVGNDFLLPSNDIGNLFFIYYLKWQLHNPIETKFRKKSGFSIKPFLGTLHLIHEVNCLWEQEGHSSVGISKEEFALFVPTLINYLNIKSQAVKLIEFRKTKDKNEFKNIFAKDFLMDNNPTKIKNLLSNLRDYGDNTIRYFRMTRYIQIRGNGFYIDLEQRRMIEILELLKFDNAKPLEFTEKEYLEYLSDKNEPSLPWKQENILVKIKKYLDNEISVNINTLTKLKIPIPKKPIIVKLTLAKEIDLLKLYLTKLQKVQQYHGMNNDENIACCIKALKNIWKSNRRSVELEKQTSLGLMALNDANEVRPNYPVGDDGEPTFTAPARVSDIECYYDSFNLVCEVTLLKDRSQWYNEGQPVMRHLREFEENNKNKISYCIFIAPTIHVDTINTFWNSVKYEYRGQKQNIIPLTINMFIQLLIILQKYRNIHKKVFSHTKLMNLYNNIIHIVNDVKTSDEWIKQIENTINVWGKCILK